MKLTLVLILTSTLSISDFKEYLSEARKLADNSQYEEAITLCFEIIEQADKIKYDSAKGHAFIRLGTIYCDLAKEDIGIGYYKQAKNVALKLNDLHLLALSHYGIAAAHQHGENYDSALYYYRYATPYFESIRDSITLSYFYSNTSLLYSQIDSIEQMEIYSRMALSIQRNFNDHNGIGASLSNIGLAANRKGEYAKAIEWFKSSLVEYELAKNEKGYAESQRWVGICYYLLGKYDSASYYFYEYETEGHAIYHQDHQNKILELETKYRTAEIAKDNAEKQTLIEKNKAQMIIMSLITISILIITIIGYFYINQKRRISKINAEKAIQDLLQQQEMKTAYALLEGQDLERKRIATELHDNLGSILTSLNMFSDALRSKKDPKKILEITDKISETSHIANQEVRKISHSLDSGLLKHFGLETAIRHLMEAITTAKTIKIELELQIEASLSNETGLEVYRIIQELVNNVLKHSACTKIRLDISHIENTMSIIFNDNGIGFHPSEIKTGLGLKNIEKRVLKMGGDLTIESEIGKGSTFIIEVPAT